MRLRLMLSICLIALAGCDNPPAEEDAGPLVDAGPRTDAGPPPTDAGMDAGPVGDDAGPLVDAGPIDDDAGPLLDAGPVDAGPVGVDAGPLVDAGSDAGPVTGCGTARPSLTGITGTEGLIIARDGTIYYSQGGSRVGRMLPGGTADDSWVSLGGGSTVWGMVLNAANDRLYVGVPNSGLYEVNTATGANGLVHTGGGINGVTLAPNGRVYFSDFSAGRVYFYDPAVGGGSTPVYSAAGASSIAGANGLAFLPNGHLLVASYQGGRIIDLELAADGTEAGRSTFTLLVTNPDGITTDADGDVYVSDQGDGSIWQFSSGGVRMNPALLTGLTSPASVEFGAGPLNCMDLYVAIGGGAARRYQGTVEGAAVPWH